MTGVSRSTASMMFDLRLSALLLAAIRVGVVIEAPPKLPFGESPKK